MSLKMYDFLLYFKIYKILLLILNFKTDKYSTLYFKIKIKFLTFLTVTIF